MMLRRNPAMARYLVSRTNRVPSLDAGNSPSRQDRLIPFGEGSLRTQLPIHSVSQWRCLEFAMESSSHILKIIRMIT